MANVLVDARGLNCPLPVVNAKKAIQEMKESGEIKVLVDNEIAVQNLQKFAKQKGFTANGEKKAEKEYEVIIQVVLNGEAPVKAAAPAEEEEVECIEDSIKKGLVIALSANLMGTGDEKLGTALMKAFVFAVTKQDVLPETIVCYNSGAFLSCEGADTLQDLKSLEAEGVNIVTCGACLDFYQLKEKLAVGSVSNMYEIVEILENAKSIVRP